MLIRRSIRQRKRGKIWGYRADALITREHQMGGEGGGGRVEENV